MLQEQTVKKITDVILPLVKLNLFTMEEVEALRRINDNSTLSLQAQVEPSEHIPDLYTLQETAKILKVTVKSVYDFIREGKLELIKLSGRTSRISGDDILDFIQSSRIVYKKTKKTSEEVLKKTSEEVS